jgi:hypothetical protein
MYIMMTIMMMSMINLCVEICQCSILLAKGFDHKICLLNKIHKEERKPLNTLIFLL